jgi:hypothetical protein
LGRTPDSHQLLFGLNVVPFEVGSHPFQQEKIDAGFRSLRALDAPVRVRQLLHQPPFRVVRGAVVLCECVQQFSMFRPPLTREDVFASISL